METVDIVMRLCVAAVAGVLLGLNRDLRGKPTGVRTLGLVGVASAVAVMVVVGHGGDAISRVIQGIVTGIGFLGAGVIIRNETGKRVHGLTTAACVWLTACIGAACGVAAWQLIVAALGVVFALLLLGGPFERFAHRIWPPKPSDDE